MTKKEMTFLGKRMKELREKNGVKTLQEMSERLTTVKSTLSRAENGLLGEKSMEEWARKYCDEFKLSKLQKEHFLRGEKIAIPDTSALLKNKQLIDELDKEYSKVIIPEIVINELNNIKNNSRDRNLARSAWEIIRGIGYGQRILKMDYTGADKVNDDEKIISVAQSAAEKYNRKIEIITDDADYSALLKGEEVITVLHLKAYMATKQELVNMTRLIELDKYYYDSYDNIQPPCREEINAYLSNGYTLIISAVRNKKANLEHRKAKIRWLISHGADVNKCDCERRYFPPLSHAIQMGERELFDFLLRECKANPNTGSRNPYASSKVRQKNEGNMPLMIAAWSGKAEFVKALCDDERTSLNQQDANGFTALIKASRNGWIKCRDILIGAGADTKIVDMDGLTAEDHYNNYLESGPLTPQRKNKGRQRK